MRREQFESDRARLLKAYFAARDFTNLKSAADQLVQLYDEYVKSCRFAMAKAFQKIEELENR